MASARHRRARPGARRTKWFATTLAAAVLMGGAAVAGQLAHAPDESMPSVKRDLTAGRTLSARADDSTRTSRNLGRNARTVPGIGLATVGRNAKGRLVKIAHTPPKIVGNRYVTTSLNVWTEPSEKSTLLDVLRRGDRVSISGKTTGAWAEVVIAGKSRWVHSAYLATEKPVDPAPTKKTPPPTPSGGGISAAPCPSGSAVEAGLTPDAIRVHRAVCAQFPSITRYIGVGGAYPHSAGLAVDIMTSDLALGQQIAEWVRANASQLGASEVIHAQHIWTVQRSSEGWRLMPDRGSPTANHMDHVHVTVYGNSGTS